MNDLSCGPIGYARDIDLGDNRPRCERHPHEVLEPDGTCVECILEAKDATDQALAEYEIEANEPDPPEDFF